jgi:hypothetical protein
MSTRRSIAPEVRNSIEAKGSTEDVEMRDASDDSEADAEGESIDEGGNRSLHQIIQKLSTYLCSIQEE